MSHEKAPSQNLSGNITGLSVMKYIHLYIPFIALSRELWPLPRKLRTSLSWGNVCQDQNRPGWNSILDSKDWSEWLLGDFCSCPMRNSQKAPENENL